MPKVCFTTGHLDVLAVVVIHKLKMSSPNRSCSVCCGVRLERDLGAVICLRGPAAFIYDALCDVASRVFLGASSQVDRCTF